MRASIAVCIMLWLTASVNAFEITGGEYFIDSDPGLGNAIALSTSSSGSPLQDTTASAATNVDLSNFTSGLHSLGVRIQDDQGRWSLTEIRKVLVLSIVTADTMLISNAEAFVDVDPGQGNGIPFILTPGDTPAISGDIDITNASPGLHSLSIRVQDESGRWSLSQRRQFLVMSPVSTDTIQFTAGEYFFDGDPGIGNGVPVNFTSSTSPSVYVELDHTPLSVGLHSLSIRLQDELGRWSLAEQRRFYKFPELLPVLNTTLTGAEYFFDANPGEGNGNSVLLPEDGAWDDTLETIDGYAANVHGSGLHTIGLRFMDGNGVWSEVEYRQFCAEGGIVAAETFIDSDPGIGQGTPLPIVSGSTVIKSSYVDVTSLSIGQHAIYVRYQTECGTWTPPSGRIVTVHKSTPESESTIAASEIYFDSLSAPGTGIAQAATDGAFGENQESADLHLSESLLTPGLHVVYTRVLAANGSWSPAVFDTITVATPDSIDWQLTIGPIAAGDSVRLIWRAVQGATEYHVHFDSLANGQYENFINVLATDTSISLASTNQQLFYLVRALGSQAFVTRNRNNLSNANEEE